jgi:hypothetical protein
MKLGFVILFLALVCGGCVSKSKFAAQQRAAFYAGQKAALQEQPKFPTVTIIGPVENSRVPWVSGLTLAQAIATANYLDPHTPEKIIITRNGEKATVNPSVLFHGAKIPLEPGDVIELQTREP